MTPRLITPRWWPRHRALVVTIAFTAGMAVGALAYYALQLNEVVLYIIAGGITAVLGAAIWEWFTRSAAVSEIEVTVPQLSRITFAVPKDHKAIARRIVVQMSTRVVVRRLVDGTGKVDAAIKSLHTFFLFVRERLDEYVASPSAANHPEIDVLAWNMLTDHLGPFLERWHPLYDDWRQANPDAPESEWRQNEEFRADLKRLQTELREYAISFARMADYANYVEIIGLGQGDESVEK